MGLTKAEKGEQEFEKTLRKTISKITVSEKSKKRIWENIKRQIEGEQK
jgi:hypothetical protein